MWTLIWATSVVKSNAQREEQATVRQRCRTVGWIQLRDMQLGQNADIWRVSFNSTSIVKAPDEALGADRALRREETAKLDGDEN